MPDKDLLNIDPHKLFELHSISEIDELQKKIHNQIEQKREDLRAMVGEKYRDLIQAADTIQEMKETTGRVIGHIKNTTAACKEVHDSHLIGFGMRYPSQFDDLQRQRDFMRGLAVQVKLLWTIPEQVCRCIEEEDFIKATQLFMFARHVITGLTLELGSRKSQKNVVSVQTIVERQGYALATHQASVMRMCRNKLKEVDLSEEVAAACLVSLYFLDPPSSNLATLLTTFIELHGNSSLKPTLSDSATDQKDIRKKIVDSFRIILKTIQLVRVCFVGPKDGGLVFKSINALCGDNSEPLIKVVHFRDRFALDLLPAVVSDYKLKSNSTVTALAPTAIAACMRQWLDFIASTTALHVPALLRRASTARAVHHIKVDILSVEIPSNWADICASVSIPGDQTDIYKNYFCPHLTDRVRQILVSNWDQIVSSFKQQMLKDLQRVSDESTEEKEADLNWFVWKDFIGETVIESREEVIDTMNSLMKGMWLQDRGYTPTLENLCRGIDKNLEKLLRDLNVYWFGEADEKQTSSYLTNTRSKFSDKDDLQIHLRDITVKNVESILDFIHTTCLVKFQSTDLQKKTSAIFSARFVQSFPQLIPNLQACFTSGRYDKPDRYRDLTDEPAWQSLCVMLDENCRSCWRKWIDLVVVDVENLTVQLPQELSVKANLDYLLVQWDTIKIEEKDEQGAPIESVIKIPAGPSLKLQHFLYRTSRLLDCVIPHTMPREAHAMFIERVAHVTLRHFKGLIEKESERINQRCALQLLMDVRHLTLLTIARENEKGMSESQQICETLRQSIDPFDYDVFYPHLQTNAKRSVQRVLTLFGSLIANHDQLVSILGTKPIQSGGTADKDPNLLSSAAAATGATPWFPLLPVTAPRKLDKPRKKQVSGSGSGSGSASASASRGKSDMAELMSASLPLNLANAKSGAAAFFGSMTSDWFGG